MVQNQVGIVKCLSKPVRPSALRECLVESRSRDTGAPAATPDRAALARSHVLVAEDDSVNQEVVRAMLESAGARVDVSANGRDAVDAASQRSYDVILMDCQMPLIDGFAATRLIRAREASADLSGREGEPARVPIIAMTASAMAGDREACFACGMDGYLSKPFSQEQLLECVARWLADSRAAAGPSSHQRVAPPTSAAPVTAADSSDPINRNALKNIRSLQQPGRPDLLERVIDTYLDQTPALIGTLREAASRDDADSMRHAAHRLNSSSANLGALALASLGRRMEALAREGACQKASQMLPSMEAEFERVKLALASESRPDGP